MTMIGWMLGVVACAAVAAGAAAQVGNDEGLAPVLVYHRFGPSAADSMTVRTAMFAAQLELLKDQGYAVVPLRQLVARIDGGAGRLPEKAVAITVDDGHRSVYSEMLPLVRRYRIPVTLFIYPSAISNASYALTWAQLEELRQSGWFDIQSHTYWHPNFRQEKRRLSPDAYGELLRTQLVKPRRILAQRLGVDANLLAWPFGIYDEELIAAARSAGYLAGFTLECRRPRPADRLLALPRCLMTDAVGIGEFQQLLRPGVEALRRRP
ncbi:MAG: polysaccharide deacetylase [Rhodocyclales bacterium RIFCSPLOWO2_02_FULL_63_24]|nr:MAG: polysaccharide deacetylase [Rhodocyclales bacterium RIFCSPLOWO2_02_FULL_63_24]